jgi:molybdopterin-containing oxidoreductase family iron-sulfur binding subunit
MHCDKAPCVTVCPAKATYRRGDGIVMQDFRRCIGCRYCIAACPYAARNFNYKPQEKEEYHRPDLPPDRASLGPWPFPQRIHGVVEKCTFCFHRIDQGLKDGKKIGVDVVPACVEACPTKARAFGDLDDPDSRVSRLLSSRDGIRLREEMGTHPKVYYLHS